MAGDGKPAAAKRASTAGERDGKASGGLTLRRVWTTPGVHPYDEVEWERRDVVMTNWRDGSVNFEQRGVEFPTFWSANASQIVTSKYFRGAPGTEAREWSLRQLIDRVVLTYSAAGERHGYFASPADAEVFAHELTHLLLHQYFSFNSPVWFNVGTPSPQQVSACLTYDSLVSTPAGLVPIGELVTADAVGTKVYDAEGTTRVVATRANGVREVRRLHTDAGSTLDVTPDHLVWEVSRGFVEAGTLRPGDRLEWHRRDSYGERELDLREVAEAALAGWLQTDGLVAAGEGELAVDALTVTGAEHRWLTTAIVTAFPELTAREEAVGTGHRIRLSGRGLAAFGERWGLAGHRDDARLPARLLTAPQPVVAAYLTSVFQAEGTLAGEDPAAGDEAAGGPAARDGAAGDEAAGGGAAAVEVVVAPALARGLQALLLRFGVFAELAPAAGSGAGAGGTVVRIAGAADRERFADAIGFLDPARTAALAAGAGGAADPTRPVTIAAVEELGPREVYDLQTESGEFLVANLRVHNCFILAVDDSMESILEWYKEEGLIFKGGSGAGVNLSRIRSSKELLSSGGTASGPVSFMRGADASAGTIKSGGATRRAAKMVILDVDHPDIEEFIETKAREEDKIRALRDAGFDMDLGGRDSVSVQYQNANNSVRVTDEFMRAVEGGNGFDLRARMDGSTVETVDPKRLFRKVAQAAWECADPGVQYDDTINDWHTNPETGRITASNPCFTGDTFVHTDHGLIRFDELVDRARRGDAFGVYTHDATNPDAPSDRVELTTPTAVMITGTNEVHRLELSNGMVLRCTPGHRFWTTNRGYVAAEELTPADRLLPLTLPTPALSASWSFRLRPGTPVAAGQAVAGGKGGVTRLPEKWTEEFAHLLGWLTGDGCVRLNDPDRAGGYGTATWVYGADDRDAFVSRHQAALAELVGFLPKPSEQANGTVQLRGSRQALVDFLIGLGVTTGHAVDKQVPAAVFQAPTDIQAAFLRGLYDADGCAAETGNGTRYVGLGSVSVDLLRDVQRMLSTFGIASRIYPTRRKGETHFTYPTVGGEEREYPGGDLYDLRISGEYIRRFASAIGFDHPRKAERVAGWLATKRFDRTDQTVTLVARTFEGFETTYNLAEPRNHSYLANGVVVRNCSEYMSLDNSSCNLASLNLMKFLREDGSFDVGRFVAAVEFVITAMDISISFADFPTRKIGDTTRAYRQLGIGYSNLGALLMASGLPYDSDGGRALAAGITSLMTAVSYRRSAELAGVVGPYEGYARNAQPHQRVMRKHAAANDEIRPKSPNATAIAREAGEQWRRGNELGAGNGWRNAQASVIAPTGCLTADTLITTDRGLARLGELGDQYGDRWQDLDLTVSTDDGPRRATKFFVNGEEATRRIVTEAGYTVQGTLAHRIKVVDKPTGEWRWKRLADVAAGDIVPMQLRTLVGVPRRVPLPVLDQAYDAGDRSLVVPDEVTEELAELVGYFMGDGSLHAKGIRLCVAAEDLDVVDRLRVLSKGLFGLEPRVTEQSGYHEVVLQSVRLARWWRAAGLAKGRPGPDHAGKRWKPQVPSALLGTNSAPVYAAFVRGLFEADGTVQEGVPSLSTCTPSFGAEVKTLLLALGLATTTRETSTGWGGVAQQVRLRNIDHALNFAEQVGFLGRRKTELIAWREPDTVAKRDRIVLPREVWYELVPKGHPYRSRVEQSVSRHGGVARQTACRLHEETGDDRLRQALDYLYEQVETNEDGGVQPTYDLSVPDNVTYVAGGMISHNTISFMLDCDTTGIEPDLALVKFKKLVGGGSMQIVNQTVPRALRSLGYQDEQVEAIVEYIAEHGHVVDAPGLKPEHYPVFDCAMGERSISAMGHVRMMAAAQAFISGSISKTVNMPESATVDDVEQIYFEGWRLGLKALAIYRDNCKVGQPLSDARSAKAAAEPEKVVEYRPVRRRLPKKRPSQTVSFAVGDAEGYLTASSYPDDGLGEIFLKFGKQGSTLAGMMDAFSLAVSVALQYGVPLEKYVEKFMNMRFEPAGMTDDPDIRFATSVMDYVARRLALDFLSYEKRMELGVFTADERAAAVRIEAGEDPELDLTGLAAAPVSSKPEVPPAGEPVGSSTELVEAVAGKSADAPLCLTCGTKMRPAGSCYVCEGCGSTSGCS